MWPGRLIFSLNIFAVAFAIASALALASGTKPFKDFSSYRPTTEAWSFASLILSPLSEPRLFLVLFFLLFLLRLSLFNSIAGGRMPDDSQSWQLVN